MDKLIAWDSSSDYQTFMHETDDPRLLAIVKRDDYPEAPDGDCYPPTIYGYDYGSRANMNVAYDEHDGIAAAYIEALQQFDEDTAERFMAIFYSTKLVHLSSRVDRYTWGIVFDSPAWRERQGIADTVSSDDLAIEQRAYLNGEVYGIGYAVNPARVTEETPVPSVDMLEAEGWDITLEVWGFYGDDWATEAALNFEYGRPELPEMLSF